MPHGTAGHLGRTETTLPDPQALEPYTQLLGHTWPGDTRISPKVLGWWGAWEAQPVTLGLLRRGLAVLRKKPHHPRWTLQFLELGARWRAVCTVPTLGTKLSVLGLRERMAGTNHGS